MSDAAGQAMIPRGFEAGYAIRFDHVLESGDTCKLELRLRSAASS